MVKFSDKINKNEIPYCYVTYWGEYKNAHTPLPCRCEICGVEGIKKSINYLTKKNKNNHCYCSSCAVLMRKQTKLEKYGDGNFNNREKAKETCLLEYGVENVSQNQNIKEKKIETTLKNYGVENPFQSEEIKEKIKDGYIENFGVEYNSQIQSVKDKRIKTNLKNFGSEWGFQSNIVQNKIKETNLEKYGVEYTWQSEEIKGKIKKTNLKRYGVSHNSQSKIIQNKKKLNNFKKYGVPHTSQINRELWQIEITSSKENLEKYLISLNKKITINELSNLLGFIDKNTSGRYVKKWDLYQYIDSFTSVGEKELTEYINSLGFITIKKRFKFGEIDIYIPELNIGFEFNGDYWHGNPLFYENTSTIKEKNAKQLWEKDKKKIESAHMMGIKIYTIWENDWKNHQDETKKNIVKILNGR